MTWDQAIMFPMVEMAGDRFKYIPDILYIYNDGNPINDNKVNLDLLLACENHIRSKPAYPTLEKAPFPRVIKNEVFQPDVLIFSSNRPLQLYAFLESLALYGKNYGQVSVLYEAQGAEYKKAYEDVEASFPQVKFYFHNGFKSDFKSKTLQIAFGDSSKSEYIVFANDGVIIKEEVNFQECAEVIDETGAYGFYLRLAPHVDFCYRQNTSQAVSHLVAPKKTFFAWDFNYGTGDWNAPKNFDLTVYKKAEIAEDIRGILYDNFVSLELKWNKRKNSNPLGLCYHTSKAVNIPLNTARQLLEKFQLGLKIDITPLHQIKNRSAHMVYQPIFIPKQ